MPPVFSLFSCERLRCVDCNGLFVSPEIHQAIHKEDKEEVERLLKGKGSFYLKETNVYTILHVASRLGSAKMVLFLLEKGMDVNVKTATGQTPLHYSQNEETVKVLLENGANVTDNLFHFSEKHREEKTVKLLEEARKKQNTERESPHP